MADGAYEIHMLYGVRMAGSGSWRRRGAKWRR